MTLSVWLFGRELLCVRVGPDVEAVADEAPHPVGFSLVERAEEY